jgi:hypothetical protein
VAALGRRARPLVPAALGLLTGITICPPFLSASVRAAERHSLPAALAFFALFFAGTAVWFAPVLLVAPLRRVPALATVARFATAIVAAYYGYLGIVTLGGRLIHG